MTRMSREFSLVLLGAGILTAGYFAAPSPEDDLQDKAERQAEQRVGGTAHTSRHHGGAFLLFLHSPGYSGTGTGRPTAMTGVSRGGFGGLGKSAAGG